MMPMVAAINALEPQMQELSNEELAAQTAAFREQLAQGRHARRSSGPGLRHRARGRPPLPQHAAFRCAVDRRHRAASRQNRRNEDRRRQNAGGDAAGVPERAGGQRRPRGHGQRLSGEARFRMDGPDLSRPGHDRRRDRARSERSGTLRKLPLRHHLRHQQRIRLRLSARQHEVPPLGLRAARALLRHRR